MAKQKSRKSRMSMGGATKLRKAKAEARAAKFARRAEAGKTYVYKPIEAKKGSEEYTRERNARKQKQDAHLGGFAFWRKTFAKLDYEVAQAELKRKEAKAKEKKSA